MDNPPHDQPDATTPGEQRPGDQANPQPDAFSRAERLADQWQQGNSKQRHGLVRHFASLPDEVRAETIEAMTVLVETEEAALAGGAKEFLEKVTTTEQRRAERRRVKEIREQIRDEDDPIDVLVRKIEAGDEHGATRYFREQFETLRQDPDRFRRFFDDEQERIRSLEGKADETYIRTAKAIVYNIHEFFEREGYEPRHFTEDHATFLLANMVPDHEGETGNVESATLALKATVENCRSPQELIGVLRELAIAATSFDEQPVRDMAARIINHQTDVLRPETPAADLLMQGITRGGRETLSDMVELRDFVEAAFDYRPEAVTPWGKTTDLKSIEKRLRQILSQRHDDDFLKRMLLIVRNRPEITPAAVEILEMESPAELDDVYRSMVVQESVQRQSRLTRARELGYYRVAHYVDEPVALVPGGPALIGEDRVTPDGLRQAFAEYPATIDPGADPYVETPYWESLARLHPDGLTNRGLRSLKRANAKLRQDIEDNGEFFLSSRGDRVIITDESLQQLGFSEILFVKNREDPSLAHVNLKLGQAIYHCVLDRESRFLEAGSRQPLELPKEAAFLQHVVLCHYRELRCHARQDSDRVTTLSGEPLDEKRFRRGHRHTLQPGHRAQPTQITLAWEEQRIDLNAENHQRAKRGQPERTYYGEIELEEKPAPMKLKTPRATEGLRRVLERSARLQRG